MKESELVADPSCVYVTPPGSIATVPYDPCVTETRVNVSPSASVSLARTSIDTLAPESALLESSTGTGRLLAPVPIVIETTPIALPPLPSLTVYVNESELVADPSWVYVTPPDVIVTVP